MLLGQLRNFPFLFQRPATATAVLRGSPDYPEISGNVGFYQTAVGVLIYAQVSGLPTSNAVCNDPFFGFHIHSGSSCTGNTEDAFADAGTHYNPNNCGHPHHAGDLPPILGNHGNAFQVFLTDRFSVDEIIGKTIVIHSDPDDFTTQPSGNSGSKIACGVIMRTARG